MKKSIPLLTLSLILLSQVLMAQNYTSANNGAWGTVANWTNTSGWGNATPAQSGYSSGTINVNHNMTITGAATFGGGGFNLASSRTITANGDFGFSNGTSNINGTININGNFTVSGGTTNLYGAITATGDLTVSSGAALNVYGTLTINGNGNLTASLNIIPGGKVYITNNLTVVNSTYLTIGTNVAPPPYADLVVYKNLVSQSSGDVTVNQNARVAVFGNVTDSGGGGTVFTINSGGQVYVHGNFTYTGGGSAVANNNPSTPQPYGLYVNGTASANTAAGGSFTANKGTKATMDTYNVPFANWVNSVPSSPLPVTLVYFKVDGITASNIDLAWATATEENFDYFVVERAGADLQFKAIATIKGKGGKGIQTAYTFSDNAPLSGKNYYRLKQVDLDFTTAYSGVVVATWSNAIVSDVRLYPNPVVDHTFTIELGDALSAPVNFTLCDVSGKVLLTKSLSEASNTIQIPDTAPGVYVVKISTFQQQRIIRIVIP